MKQKNEELNWSKIFNFNQPVHKVFYDILLSRGFLVELIDNNLYLSDNALLKDDLFFLMRILERSSMGSIGAQRKITPSSNFTSNDSLNSLFSFQKIQGEAFYMKYKGKWKIFKRYDKGLKVPISEIEPGVALFVKALSAVGIRTWSSCDGHGESNAYVNLISDYDELWFRILFNFILDVSQKKIKHIKWVIKSNTIHIKKNESSDILLYFSELFDFATFLYHSRKHSILLKRKFIDIIQSFMLEIKEDKEYNLVQKKQTTF